MELSLANHVHELDPGQDLGGRSKGFETEHGSGDSFDGAVILLDDVVEVFDLAHHHRKLLVFDDLVNDCYIGTALVHGHFLRNLIGTHGLLEKPHGWLLVASGGQQEVMTVEDVLARRSRLLFLDAALAKSMAAKVANLLQKETGVDPQLNSFLVLCDQYFNR